MTAKDRPTAIPACSLLADDSRVSPNKDGGEVLVFRAVWNVTWPQYFVHTEEVLPPVTVAGTPVVGTLGINVLVLALDRSQSLGGPLGKSSVPRHSSGKLC